MLIGVPVFLVCTFLVYKMTIGTHRKSVTVKMSKVRGTRIFYWESVIMISSGITFAVFFIANLLYK